VPPAIVTENLDWQSRPRLNSALRTLMRHWVMIGLVRFETVLVILVVLNLVGLTIAAFVILRRK
jgi:hypothetical protein